MEALAGIERPSGNISGMFVAVLDTRKNTKVLIEDFEIHERYRVAWSDMYRVRQSGRSRGHIDAGY